MNKTDVARNTRDGGHGEPSDTKGGGMMGEMTAKERAIRITSRMALEYELSEHAESAYRERDAVLAMAFRMALEAGYPVWMGKHEGGPWDNDWRNLVFIQLPTGQVSWHIHDSEVKLFTVASGASMTVADRWDGHSTGDKYDRVERFVKAQLP